MNEQTTSGGGAGAGGGAKARKADREKLWQIARGELDPNTKALHGKTRAAYVKKGWLDTDEAGVVSLTDCGRGAADIPLNGVPPLAHAAPADPNQMTLPPEAVGGLVTALPKAPEQFRLIGKARGTVVGEQIGRFHVWVGDNRVGKTTRLDCARKALGLPHVGPADRGCVGTLQVEAPGAGGAPGGWVEAPVAGLAPAHDLLDLGPSLFRERVAERFTVKPEALESMTELNEAQIGLLNQALAHVAPNADLEAEWSGCLVKARTKLTTDKNQLKAKLDVAKEQSTRQGADPVVSGAFATLDPEVIRRRIEARKWHDSNRELEADMAEWLTKFQTFEEDCKAEEPVHSEGVTCDACGGQTTTWKQALHRRRTTLLFEREQLIKRVEQAGPKPPIDPDETVLALEDQLSLVLQSQGARQAAPDTAAQVGEYTVQVTNHEELLKWIERQLDSLNSRSVEQLLERVNRALPAHFRAVFEKGRLSVVGADGKPHFKGSSGAEKALLALALALAWREDVTALAPPAIMPLEFETDLAPMDPATCYEFLIALRDDPRIRGLWISTTQWMNTAILQDLGFVVQVVGGAQ